MILLRQKIYGLTNDGGGTNSMNFYKNDPETQKMLQQYRASGGKEYTGMGFADFIKKNKTESQYRASGGKEYTGMSLEDFAKKNPITGLSNQQSNMTNDKSSYRGASLRQGTTQTGKPNTIDNRMATRDTSKQAQQAANNARIKRLASSSFRKQEQNNAFKQGQQSVGLWGGAKNTWKGMTDTQKGLAIGGAAAATIGTGALLLRNRKKRKEAERELELERARNRR